MGSAPEHHRGRCADVGAVRERPSRRGARVRQPRHRARHAKRAVLLPSRHDRARRRPHARRPSRPGDGDRHQPFLLDLVVEACRVDPGADGRRAVISARRIALLAILTSIVLGGIALAGAPPAAAHPLGNFTVNRYSGIDLAPGSVRITYVLDMAEIPTYQETPNIDSNGDGTITDAERQAWADRTAPALEA